MFKVAFVGSPFALVAHHYSLELLQVVDAIRENLATNLVASFSTLFVAIGMLAVAKLHFILNNSR